jgi:hypothetical protein
MKASSRGWRAIGAVLLVAVTVPSGLGPAVAQDASRRLPGGPQSVAGMAGRGTVETVHSGDRRQTPVMIARGQAAAAQQPISREVVSFGDGTATRVTIVRGTVDPAAAAAPMRQAALAPQNRIERVNFVGATPGSVLIVRGGAALRDAFSVDLFGSPDAGEFDRIAHAVHGVESSHGTNPAMWRPSLSGPQGPMQVSAAAAVDVGGGDRFDIADNRRLGRAYLDKMYRRYGNWPDALAGYNWGPGNVDQWIARGRGGDRLPLETIRYIEIVLRNALLTRVAGRL